MQYDKSFTSHFVDPDTRLPIEGLTDVRITIKKKVGSTYTKVVDNQLCTDIADGWYLYEYETIEDEFYLYAIYPNDDRVHPESGFVDKRLNNLDGAITDIRAGGGGVNLSGISSTISNSSKYTREELKKYIDEKVGIVVEKIDNKNLDITPILDKIESIPEQDDTRIIESLGIMRTNLTKLSNFIRSEAEKEKNEEKKKMSEEYESKISELVDKIEEMEDAYEELDLSISDKEKLIEDMEKTAEEIIDELEKEKQDAKSIAKKDIISSLSE